MTGIMLELGVCALLIGIDLVSKGLIMPFLADNGGSYSLIDGIFGLQYAENDGASFGIFAGNTTLLLVITIVTTVLMIAALIYLSDKPKLLRYSLVTIIGGAIGNIVDRVAFGYVRDFIDYQFIETWFGIPFAIGNIADIFCIVGVLMVIVYIFFDYREGDLQSRFKRFNKCKKVV